MSAVGIVGSIGVGSCPRHRRVTSYTTIIVSGAPTVLSNGAQVAQAGVSIGVSSCGHATLALTGSVSVRAEGAGVHRVGDMGRNFGPYILTSGAANVLAGE